MALDIERIQKNVRKLRKFLKNAPTRPAPEEVHDLRTQIRRFETNVEALQFASKRNERSLSRRLKRIRKQAGKIRDMDVLTAHASAVQVAGENDCLIQVIEYLGARRYKKARQLKAMIGRDVATVRRRLKRTSKRFEKCLGESNKKPSDQRSARADATASALEHSEDLMSPEILHRGNLHSYRLKVKELRDILTIATQRPTEKFVDKLGEVKDAIGEWHDWEELIAISGEVLAHGRQCKLMRKLKAIGTEKFEAALSLTNQMRKEYLGIGRRSGVQDQHQQTTTVLKASSAIATRSSGT